MKPNKKCISLELAKKLKGCGITSSHSYLFENNKWGAKRIKCASRNFPLRHPAFSWQEILWKYSDAEDCLIRHCILINKND